MIFLKNKKTKNPRLIIKKISIVSIFLSLAIIFTFLSTLMPLPFLSAFLNLNLASIFLAVLFLIVNFYYSVFATIITSLVVFINSGIGSWVGVIVNLVSNLFFISILYLVNFWLMQKSINQNKLNNHSKFTFNLKWHYFSEIISVLTTTFVLVILNGLLFTPLFWYVFQLLDLNSPSFIEAMHAYNNSSGGKVLMLGIPDYWSGIFALYTTFNLLNFSICSIAISAAKKFIIQSKILKRISNEDLGGLIWKLNY